MMNVFRQVFSMIIPFYAYVRTLWFPLICLRLRRIPFGDRIGFEYAWLVFAIINVVLFVRK